MRIESVNIGKRAKLTGPGYSGISGIFKEAQSEPLRVTELGLVGDEIVNGRHHGGPDQALYLYRSEDYDWWAGQLGRELTPGLFGENLTVSGMPSADAKIGSRISFDHVTLELTAPRIPCGQFAARMGDKAFVKAFVEANRPGFYARVLKTGQISAGEDGEFVEPTEHDVSIVELYQASYRTLNKTEIERFLSAPIDVRTRTKFEARLAQLA
ncbi:MAG: MOSC domain-containing protein [Pseudomonadaceae bacterium]|nr:MOSC domain-containing protein [Pseudomonadaceae bacterium]